MKEWKVNLSFFFISLVFGYCIVYYLMFMLMVFASSDTTSMAIVLLFLFLFAIMILSSTKSLSDDYIMQPTHAASRYEGSYFNTRGGGGLFFLADNLINLFIEPDYKKRFLLWMIYTILISLFVVVVIYNFL